MYNWYALVENGTAKTSFQQNRFWIFERIQNRITGRNCNKKLARCEGIGNEVTVITY